MLFLHPCFDGVAAGKMMMMRKAFPDDGRKIMTSKRVSRSGGRGCRSRTPSRGDACCWQNTEEGEDV